MPRAPDDRRADWGEVVTSGVRIDVASLGALVQLGVGGQGVVHATPLKLRHLALPLVFKEYKATVIRGLDVSVLEAMPTYLETLPFADGMELLSQSAWPCRLVEEAGVVKGFVMPTIPADFFLDMKKAAGVSRQMAEFQHLLNDDSFLARRQIPITDRHRYELVAEVAGALSIFHRHRIAVGDLSPKNLLFSISPATNVFFIDCDAMRFQGRSVVPQLETPDWEVRAVNPGEELGTRESDAYKLGLLALRLLAGDQSTRDPGQLPRSVPGDIRNLVAQALQPRPADRPRPTDWSPALTTAATGASTKPPVASRVAPVARSTWTAPRSPRRSPPTVTPIVPGTLTTSPPPPTPRPSTTAATPPVSRGPWWKAQETTTQVAVVAGIAGMVLGLVIGASADGAQAAGVGGRIVGFIGLLMGVSFGATGGWALDGGALVRGFGAVVAGAILAALGAAAGALLGTLIGAVAGGALSGGAGAAVGMTTMGGLCAATAYAWVKEIPNSEAFDGSNGLPGTEIATATVALIILMVLSGIVRIPLGIVGAIENSDRGDESPSASAAGGTPLNSPTSTRRVTTTPNTAASTTTSSTVATTSSTVDPSGATGGAGDSGQSGNPDVLTGRWTGSYTCAQGETALTLDIASVPSARDQVTAVFSFSALPSNPGVPSGEFLLSGTLTDDLLELTPDRWTVQPDSGWAMVGLRGTYAATRQELTGDVVGPGCTTFNIRKAP